MGNSSAAVNGIRITALGGFVLFKSAIQEYHIQLNEATYTLLPYELPELRLPRQLNQYLFFSLGGNIINNNAKELGKILLVWQQLRIFLLGSSSQSLFSYFQEVK